MIAIFPEISQCVREGDLEMLSVVVRRYFGGKAMFSPRIDMTAFADFAGIHVVRKSLDYHGAVVARDERGRFEINFILKQGLDPVAERFAIAHMLGHFFLEIQPEIAAGDFVAGGFRETVCPMQRYGRNDRKGGSPEELRADDFAAALLLPRGMVARAVEKLIDLDKVAVFFGVSRLCLEHRMMQIGMMADRSLTPETANQTSSASSESQKKPGGLNRLREIAKKLDRFAGK